MSSGDNTPLGFETVERDPPPRRPLWRRILRAAAAAGIFLVALLVCAVGFLHTPWGKALVRSRLEHALAAKVHGQVRLGTLDYTFLLGELTAGELHIRDRTGRPVIELGSVRVALDRRSLLAGEPRIEALELDGLTVAIVDHGDGTTNLTDLFARSGQPRRPLQHLTIRRIAVRRAKATLTKADGTRLAIEDLGLAAALEARPAARIVDLTVAELSGRVRFAPPGGPEKIVPIGLASLSIKRDEGALDAGLQRLVAGPLALEAIALHAGLADGALTGPQRFTLTGLRLDHVALADLAGRTILAGDVTAEASIMGPPERLVVTGALTTGGGTLALEGTIDASRPGWPRYDLALAGTDLASERLVTPSRPLPPVHTTLHASLSGEGLEAARRRARLTVSLGPTQVGPVPVEGFELAARAEGGVVEVDRLTARALGLALTGRATVKPAERTLEAELALTGDAARAAAALRAAGLPVRPLPLPGALDVALKVRAQAASLAAELRVRRPSDHAVLAAADVELPLRDDQGRRRLRPEGAWRIAVDLPTRRLAELVAVVPALRRRGLETREGVVSAHLMVAGTPAQPTGTFDLDLGARALPAARQKLHLHGAIATASGRLTVTANADARLEAGGEPLLGARGSISLPSPLATGSGDRPDLRAALAAATVELALDLPPRAIASLAGVTGRPGLARVPGTVGGRITVRGRLAAPDLDARLAWSGYLTAAGGRGQTTLHAWGTPARLAAEIRIGGNGPADSATILAAIDRSMPDAVRIHARARAERVPVLALLPAFLAAGKPMPEPGHLDWNMDGSFTVWHGRLEDAALTGTLALAGGAFAIPGTHRRYDHIGVRLAAEKAGLRIESLTVREHDLEKKERRLDAAGLLAWNRLRPETLSLNLRARDWLLYGTPTLGRPDAPRGAADFDVGVVADLRAPVVTVDATVRSLDLRAPDRYDRAHQPERISISGDVIFLDETLRPAGRLPAAPAEAHVAASARPRRPIEIRVHIPRLVRIHQAPFDVRARGELTISVRDGRVVPRGELEIPRGQLALFGQVHQLRQGTLRFSEAHPHGELDLVFERQLPPAFQRDLVQASAHEGIRVKFAGAPTAPKVTLSGAGNAALVGVMTMHNAGRPALVTHPGMPASATVQAPRGEQPAMLTFMATNLPHLLFLDRYAAWADPYDSREAYGRVERFEGERYAKDDHSRVRVVTRPPTPGRSEREVQWDRLLLNDDRKAAGVGVRAGSRLGGGVGVFVEWSSAD